MDMNETVQILQTLSYDTGSPPRLDLEIVIRDGRRRRHRRRLGNASAIAAVLAIAVAIPVVLFLRQPKPPPAPLHQRTTPLQCTEAMLPTPKGTHAEFEGADPTGQYMAGQLTDAAGRTLKEGILWHGGNFETFSLPSAREYSGMAVSSQGMVAISFDRSDGVWFYYDHSVHSLPAPANAMISAINAHGAIVANVPGDTQNGGSVAFWSSPTATMKVLPIPAGYAGATVVDIADDGTIVGGVRSRNATSDTPIIWHPNGGYQILPTPPRPWQFVNEWGFTGRSMLAEVVKLTPNYYFDDVVAYSFANHTYSILSQRRFDRAPGAISAQPSSPTVPSGPVAASEEVGPIGPTAPIAGPPPRLPDLKTNDRLEFTTAVSGQGWSIGSDGPRAAMYTPMNGVFALPTPPALSKRGVAMTISADGMTIGGWQAGSNNAAIPVMWRCH